MANRLRDWWGRGRVAPSESLGGEDGPGAQAPTERDRALQPFRVLVPVGEPNGDQGICELEKRALEVLRICEAVRVIRKSQKERDSPDYLRREEDCRPEPLGDSLDFRKPIEEILKQVEESPELLALAGDHANVSPDDAWNEYLFKSALLPGQGEQKKIDTKDTWHSPHHGRAVNALLELVDSMKALLWQPEPDGHFRVVDEPAPRNFRFTSKEGGEGATPLFQCILKRSPAALLAARFIVYRFPDLVLDAYGSGPYLGEHLLHMCIVVQERDFVLFVERHVRGGFGMLQRLGNTPHFSRGSTAKATLLEQTRQLAQETLTEAQQEYSWYPRLGSAGAAGAAPRDKDGEFFDLGKSCYYGGFPLSFAAATGSALWWFMYLVNRLQVDVNKKDEARGNTALHLAVLWGNNESYRYLRALGADDTILNDDDLTPLQLSAQIGCKVTQVPVTGNDVHEMPANAKDDQDGKSMLCFILELNSKKNWTFGNVVSTRFRVEQVHGPRGNSQYGTSCLKLVCDAQQLALLCPSESSMDNVRMQNDGRNIYVKADDDINETFRMLQNPGTEGPPVSSFVLLIIAEYCWNSFGRKLLLLELFLYACHLGLLTFATVDRSSSSPALGATAAGRCVDGCLFALIVFLAIIQTIKSRLVQEVWNRTLLKLQKTELFFMFVFVVAFGCTVSACIIRFRERASPGGGSPYPYDGELLACASLASFTFLLYYLRCFSFIGPLAIVVIEMLLRDVTRILVIYACFLAGFSVAIHAVIFSGGFCARDDYCSADDPVETAASFVTIPRSLLSTVMMIMANFDLGAIFSSRVLGVALAFFFLYIIVANILLMNLLIALLNKTFGDIYEQVQQSFVIQRTQVVLQLERLAQYTPWLGGFVDRCYEKWLDGEKRDERTKIMKEAWLNVERVNFEAGVAFAEPPPDPLGTAAVDGDTRSFRTAKDLIKEVELAPRRKLAFDEGHAERQAAAHVKREAAAARAEAEEILKALAPAEAAKAAECRAADLADEADGNAEKEGLPAVAAAVSAAKAAAQQAKAAAEAAAATSDEAAAKAEAAKAAAAWVDAARAAAEAEAAEASQAWRLAAEVRRRIRAKLPRVGPSDTLLVVDMQNSFVNGRGLRVKGALAIVPVVNELISFFDERGATVAFTQDYHPPDHSAFASVHNAALREADAASGRAGAREAAPLEVVHRSYGQQKLWPEHCIMGTRGCKFVDNLYIPDQAIIVQKGHRSHVDSYSAFFDADRVSRTGLLERLQERRAEQRERRRKGEPEPERPPARQVVPALSVQVSTLQPAATLSWHEDGPLFRSGAEGRAPMPMVEEEPGTVPLLAPLSPGANGREDGASDEVGGQGKLYIIGLAYDECVRYTAEDAAVLKHSGAQADNAEAQGGGEPAVGCVDGAKAGWAALVDRLRGGSEASPAAGGEAAVPGAAEAPPSKAAAGGGTRWRSVVVIEAGTRLIFESRREEIRRTLKAMGVRIMEQEVLLPKGPRSPGEDHGDDGGWGEPEPGPRAAPALAGLPPPGASKPGGAGGRGAPAGGAPLSPASPGHVTPRGFSSSEGGPGVPAFLAAAGSPLPDPTSLHNNEMYDEDADTRLLRQSSGAPAAGAPGRGR